MSTRAIIEFSDKHNTFLLDRSHDGFLDIVLDDIKLTLKESLNRWSEPELGCLISLFISITYDYKNERLPKYEIISSIPNDVDYEYFVIYNYKEKRWEFGLK